MKLFALAIGATKEPSRISYAAACTAQTKAEAIGMGMERALQNWPQSDGWHSHFSVTCEITAELLADVTEAKQ